MTKIRDTGSNPYIEDRRGQSMPGGGGGFGLPDLSKMGRGGLPGMSGCGGKSLGVGGGGMAILLVVAALLLPKLLGGSATTGSSGTVDNSNQFDPLPDASATTVATSGANTCDTQIAQIVCGAVTDVNEFWIRQFQASGATYEPAKTVFYSGATQTACGTGQAETGPFYCPLDSLVYFDLDFLEQLQQQFDAEGDLASQYIVAHEYGHHVQNVQGISERVRQLQQQDPSNANAYSVRLELQADCLAGVWAHDAEARGKLEAGDLAEALNAAAAVGDDRIQRKSGVAVNEESWTHGSSEQRQTWFRRGFDTGDPSQCNTFAE